MEWGDAYMQKLVIWIAMIIITISTCIFVSCRSKNDDVVAVQTLEDGFTLIDNAMFDNKALSYLIMDSCIYIFDNNIAIYHTSLSNKNFIVKYSDEYYVNGDLLSVMEWMDGYDAITVFTLPEGFISLDMVLEKNIALKYEFFESGIFFSNDGRNTYHTVLTDSDFIVKYKNVYYVA